VQQIYYIKTGIFLVRTMLWHGILHNVAWYITQPGMGITS